MGNFVIERKSQDSAMKFKMVVRINGGEKIELMPGQRKEIELVDGVYNIVVSLNMQKKNINIEMPQENKVIISYEVDGVHIESLNKPKEYDLGATSAPTVNNEVDKPSVASSEAISEVLKETESKMYCSKCGAEIEANSKFCSNCGSSKNSPNVLENNTVQSNTKAEKVKTNKIGKIISAIIVVAVLLGIGRYASIMFGSVSDADACKEAETEIKSVVYNEYGVVPKLESEVIYSVKDGKLKDDIVVVKYILEDSGIDGSYTVHIHCVRSSAYVMGETKEQAYDFDYKEDLEELIALYKIKE